MKKTALITNILLATLSLLFLYGCNPKSTSGVAQESTFEKIKKAKTIKVGYIIYPPMVTKNPNTGKLNGHFIATIKDIADQAGWKLKFIETDWSGFAAGLNSRRFDLSIAPTFTTIPRLTKVSFTQPLIYAGNSAIVRANDKRFTQITDFNNKEVTLAVTQGEAGHEYALANLPEAKLIVHPGSNQSLAFQDVLAGRADAALGDAYITAQFVLKHKDKLTDLFADNPYNLTPVSWAIGYGDNDLLAFLNNAIAVLSIQGKLRQYEKEAGANWIHAKTIWITD